MRRATLLSFLEYENRKRLLKETMPQIITVNYHDPKQVILQLVRLSLEGQPADVAMMARIFAHKQQDPEFSRELGLLLEKHHLRGPYLREAVPAGVV